MAMASILALALQAAVAPAAPPAPAPPAPVPPAPAPAPRPTDWPFRLFSRDDYPAAALRAEEEGIVGYHLDIGADGRVRNCQVRRSSGSAALDAGTCRIVTRRARFRPATDGEGRAVPDARDGEVIWRLGQGE